MGPDQAGRRVPPSRAECHLEIEVKGALQVRERAPSALYIFIDVPRFWELEKRLRNRGTEDDAASIAAWFAPGGNAITRIATTRS